MIQLPTNIPVSLLKNTTKFQVGMVVRDARRTAKEYEKFGVGPFVEEEFPGVEATVYGKPAKFLTRALTTIVGGWELELLQVLEGETIFQDFLKKRGEGVHHLGLYVEDYDAEMAKWKGMGIRTLQESKCPPPYPEGSRYAYLDTEKLFGIILEIAWPTTISLR
ncbi:MAG TPA: VOC family protein [Nitrososphaerales archaeon]|nr:VOC family protein [Nitrososphaerales archaeon]